jgi:hypothetical protein
MKLAGRGARNKHRGGAWSFVSAALVQYTQRFPPNGASGSAERVLTLWIVDHAVHIHVLRGFQADD